MSQHEQGSSQASADAEQQAHAHGKPPKGAREAKIAEEHNPLKRALSVIGPGVITGASDSDPTSVACYSVAGASLGYALQWAPIVVYPMMATVEFLCSKIGLVTGKGLAAVLKQHYPRWILYAVLLALVFSNVITAGADIGAIAAAIDLLAPVPSWLAVLAVGVGLLAFQIWGTYALIERVFKWLTLVLFAYVVSAFFARPDWWSVLWHSVRPTLSLDAGFLTSAIAILGTTTSPYMFFWQTSAEVEQKKQMGRRTPLQRRGTTPGELKWAALDINLGMAFYNMVTYFIMLSTAATLHASGHTHIGTASEAASALRPVAGPWAEALFALGIIGGGFLSVPIITTSVAYGLADAFGWREGLNQKPRRAWRFYAVITACTLIAMGIVFLHLNAIAALFWSSVLSGLVVPPVLVMIMLATNNRAIVGEHTNGKLANFFGWLTTAVMAGLASAFLVITLHAKV